jgi:hypothetical protein
MKGSKVFQIPIINKISQANYVCCQKNMNAISTRDLSMFPDIENLRRLVGSCSGGYFEKIGDIMLPRRTQTTSPSHYFLKHTADFPRSVEQ